MTKTKNKKRTITKKVTGQSKFLPASAIPGAVIFEYESKGYSKKMGVPVEEVNCQMNEVLSDILFRCGRKARGKRWQRKENIAKVEKFKRQMRDGEMHEFVVHLMVSSDGNAELCSMKETIGESDVYTSDGLHKVTAADEVGYKGLVQVKIWMVDSDEAASRHLNIHDSKEAVRSPRERAGFVFCGVDDFQFTTTTLAEMNSCLVNIVEDIPAGGTVMDSVPTFKQREIHTIENYERMKSEYMPILKWYNSVLRLEGHKVENKGLFHVGIRTAIVHSVMAHGEQLAWPIWKKLISGVGLNAQESKVRTRLVKWVLDKQNNKGGVAGQAEEYNRSVHAFMAIGTMGYIAYKSGVVYSMKGILGAKAA